MKRKAKPKPKGTGRDIAAIMRANKGANTKPELRFRALLRARGLLGYRVHPKGLIGKPDVVYTRWRVAVFVHGCYWHACPVCAKTKPRQNAEFWAEKFAANVARDEKVRRALEEGGYEVVTVWEHELKADADAAVERVATALRTRGKPLPD